MNLEDATNLIDDLLTGKTELYFPAISEYVKDIVKSFLSGQAKVNTASSPRENLVLPCGLLSICMKYQIQDSEIVKQVLLFTWHSVRDLSVLFSRQWLKKIYWNPRYLKWDRSFLFNYEDEVVQMFFLKHAYKSKLKIDDRRIVDIIYCKATSPINEVISRRDVNTVKILLKFGCELELEKSQILDMLNKKRSVDFFKIVKLDDLAREVRTILLMLRLLYLRDNSLQENYEDVNESTKKYYDVVNMIQILNIILRATPKLGRNIFCITKLVARTTLPCSIDIGCLNMSDEGYDVGYISNLSAKIPSLPERTLMPASLKHFCRCKIRGILNKSWRLPYGIYDLPLPKHMKLYLDLEYD